MRRSARLDAFLTVMKAAVGWDVPIEARAQGFSIETLLSWADAGAAVTAKGQARQESD